MRMFVQKSFFNERKRESKQFEGKTDWENELPARHHLQIDRPEVNRKPQPQRETGNQKHLSRPQRRKTTGLRLIKVPVAGAVGLEYLNSHPSDPDRCRN